jgi:hypothetical protein
MKILYFLKDNTSLMYKWQHVHIFEELERHGCSIIVFNPLHFNSYDDANEELVIRMKREKFDLFMTPHGHQDIYVESIREIKKIGIPTLLICFDNLIVPFMHEKIAQYFDLVWLTSNETAHIFKKSKCNYVIQPYAANPYYFTPKYDKEINRLAFVGTPYGTRINGINMLINKDISVTLFANLNQNSQNGIKLNGNFEQIKAAYNLSRFRIGRKVLLGAIKHRLISDRKLCIENPSLIINGAVGLCEMNKIYSNYSLSLSFTEALRTGSLNESVPIINLRSFEIPMSGGLQFCKYNEELESYFKDDNEIVFFRDSEEFVSKAKFYLRPENFSLRIKIKKLARKRAEEQHTWFHRFSITFSRLGLSLK